MSSRDGAVLHHFAAFCPKAMEPLEVIIVLLFAVFLVGTIFRIISMLERKKAGESLERSRLVFFFTACLMLVCMIPLAIFEMLSVPVSSSDVVVVATNFLGFALTYKLRFGKAAGDAGDEKASVRAYLVYYRGSPYGMITREGFDGLLQYGLLKRQRTVELVEDFKRSAREQGVGIRLLKNRDGSQTLIKVDTPEDAGDAPPEE